MRIASRRYGAGAGRRADGFTLMEVMIVMAIVSLLLGFGIGLFQRLGSVGESAQAQNTIVETIETVKNSSQRWPAALVVDPVSNTIQGLEFRTVMNCNFETADDIGIVGLQHKYGQPGGDAALEPFPMGHTGGAMVCSTGGFVNFGNFPDYDLIEGVSIDLWVFPVDNRAMTLIEKGESYGIRLKSGRGGPIVEAWLRLVEEDESMLRARGSETRYEVPDYPLVPNRWNRVVFNYARSGASIAIDAWGTGAVERYPNESTKDEERNESRRILPDDDADMIVGGKSGWIVGRVDDLKVAGIIAGERRSLPENVVIKGDKIRRIRFRNGRLDPEYHRGEETITIEYDGVPNEITIGVLGNILRK